MNIQTTSNETSEFDPMHWLSAFICAGGQLSAIIGKDGHRTPAFSIPCFTEQEIEVMPALNKMLNDLTIEQKAAIRPLHADLIGLGGAS